MVDTERLRGLIDRLRAYLADLDRLAALPGPEVRGDPDRVNSVKYSFVIAIECCIDLANHLIASERFRAPVDYGGAFRSLQEAAVLEEPLAVRMQAAERFRNRLVHLYWDVDSDLLMAFLQSERATLRAYA